MVLGEGDGVGDLVGRIVDRRGDAEVAQQTDHLEVEVGDRSWREGEATGVAVAGADEEAVAEKSNSTSRSPRRYGIVDVPTRTG